MNRAPQTKPTDGSSHWSSHPLAIASGILQEHGSPLSATLLDAAPPSEEFQAVDKPLICRKDPRHRRPLPLPQSVGQRRRAQH